VGDYQKDLFEDKLLEADYIYNENYYQIKSQYSLNKYVAL